MSSGLLIIDVGHSRIKYSLYNGEQVVRESFDLKPFSKCPQKFLGAKEILLMGTNEAFCVRLLSHLKSLKAPTPTRLGIDCRVPIASLSHPEQTGNDRLANALGAKFLFPKKEVLIVSAGSALVIDFLNAQGEHEGGLISLGWHSYRQSISNINPRLLPPENLTFPTFAGINTAEATQLGWWWLAQSAILQILKTHAECILLFTGGDAEALSKRFEKAFFYPHLGSDALAKALGYFTFSPVTDTGSGIEA